MNPHEQRVLIERYELYRKELDLANFINTNPVFPTLDSEDQALLNEQLTAMTKYREILEQRIARFPK